MQLVLTRLLLPADFGLVAIAASVVAFAQALFAIALEPAVVREPTLSDRERWGAEWLAIAIAGGLFAVLVVIAPLLGNAFGDDRLRWVLPTMGLLFPVGGFGLARRVALQRSISFRPIVASDLAGFFVSAVVAVALASAGTGPLALVIQPVLASLVSNLVMYVTHRDEAHGPSAMRSATRFLRFGGTMALAAGVNYAHRYADNLLIGAVLGATQLGYYSRAYSLMLLPVLQISGATGRVALPALVRMGNPRRQADAYLRFVGVIALATFPVMTWVAVDGKLAIEVLLGSRWSDAGLIIQILAPVGAIQSVTTSVGWVYQVRDRPGLLLRWTVAATPVFIVGFVLGVVGGSTALVAAGYAIATMMLVPFIFRTPCRLLQIRQRDVWSAVRPAALIAGMVGASTILTSVLTSQWDSTTRLLASGPAAVGGGLAGAMLFGGRPVQDLRQVLADVRNRSIS